MWSQLINVVLSVISLVLIVYNINIYKVQKTPVQQNWLSTGLALQLLLPISFLLKGCSDNVLSSYIVYSVIIYGLLYNTKFCISCKKGLIKRFILMLSVYIPVIYLLLNVELFRSLEPFVGVGYLTVLFVLKNYLLLIMTILPIVAIGIMGFLDRKNVSTSINILRIFLSVGLLSTGVTIILGDYNLLIISKVLLIVIDIFLVKIVWINKGRFYRHG